MPGVLKGGNLRRRLLTIPFREKDIVVGVGVKGRIQINQVNAGVRHLLPQDAQVVAEVEFIAPIRQRHPVPSTSSGGCAPSRMVCRAAAIKSQNSGCGRLGRD